MKKKILLSILLLITPIIVSAHSKESISLNPSWRFANFSKINSGSATLYTNDNSNGHTVTINAGHGTKGGGSVKTLSHPDGTGKVTGGSNPNGAVESAAVSSGMDFPNGTSEATITLKLAIKIRDILLDNGYNVLMIRETSDVQLDNIARTVIANNKSDIHIAVHFDSSNSDKGAFYTSVPEGIKYLDNVANSWQQSEALGDAIIKAFKENGVKVCGSGSQDMDLTQTSYTEIASIDLEYGDKNTDISDANLDKMAEATVKGIAYYFNEDYTPTKKGNNNNSSDESYSLDTSNLTENDQKIMAKVVSEWPKELQSDRIAFIQRAISLMNIGIIYCNLNSEKCPRMAAMKADPTSGDQMDCSDYVSNVFMGIGKSDVGDNTVAAFNSSSLFSKVDDSEILPGDLAIRLGSKSNHILIYLGTADGKKIYAHSSRSGPSGPQLASDYSPITHYIRYNNWNGEYVKADGTKSGKSGDKSPVDIKEIQIDWHQFENEHISCETIFIDEDGEPNTLGEAVNDIFTLMKVAAPVLTIALSTMEYIKAIANSNAEEMKKTNKRTIKRIVIGLVLFFLPDLLNLLFKIFGLYGIGVCTM